MISLNIGTIVVALVSVFMLGKITGIVLTQKQWRKICDDAVSFWKEACMNVSEDYVKLRKELNKEKENG